MSDDAPEAEFIDVDEIIGPETGSDRAVITKSTHPGKRSQNSSNGANNFGQRDGLEIPRSPLAKVLSWILDECITIPGTNVRIGLDPILGLIPAAGGGIASVAGALIIGESYRQGVSMKVVFRMAGNLILNAGIGAVPGIGDLFSAVFKSNKKNYKILDDFLDNPLETGKRRRIWPIIVSIGLIAIAINVAIWMLFLWLTKPLWEYLFQ